MKTKNKEILTTLIFVLPYIIVEFTNTILVVIDKSLSNSIGKTAVIVFSSFLTLNWTINTMQTCLGKAHGIVLVRNKKENNTINTTAILIELTSSLIIGSIIFIFAKQITYVYQLEQNARDILTTILKLKAIQLPFVSVTYVLKNDLKIKEKTNAIFIITLISSAFNIVGDLISIQKGYNEIGIYVATIVSTIINLVLLLIVSKFKISKISIAYMKEIIKYSKDLIFDKIIQRIVNITFTRVASSFGTNTYAIHCVCIAIPDTLMEMSTGYYSGLLVDYSKDIENKKEKLLNKVDQLEFYGIIFSLILGIFLVYPSWWLLGRSIPWEECNPYIWLYSIEFIIVMGSCNYQAYLSAHKDTKAIRNMALIGGILVRIPFIVIIKYFNLGLIGLSLACSIDRIVRIIYLRLYIKNKFTSLVQPTF